MTKSKWHIYTNANLNWHTGMKFEMMSSKKPISNLDTS